MQVGKLPPELLSRLLQMATWPDPRVLLGPRVGEDAAAVDFGDGRVLVLKADPISYASDLIGWYAVHVNANDLATMAAKPAFFLATLLLPPTIEEDAIEPIFRQIGDACREIGAVLAGGHTEVTPGITSPILAGAMVGEVHRDRMVLTSGAQPGDRLLLTKGVAIEGSALLAHDFADALLAAGVSSALINSGRDLLFRPGISVVPDCRILLAAGPVHAMHDPTEGGLAGALFELAAASGCGVRVDQGRIPLLPETVAFTQALDLDPMRMLASGALLAAVPAETVETSLRALSAAGIKAAKIGEVTQIGDPVILKAPGGETTLEGIPQDEVARFLASRERGRATIAGEGPAPVG